MSSEKIRYVQLDNPPVNALSHSLRASIVEQLRSANDDPSIEAIVLLGSEKTFSAGADISEFGTPKATAAPDFPQILQAVEGSAKPVIAAISGICMGGGLELALAAHARAAKPDARLALPEVNIGIIPGAGGTQRLPRAVQPADAVDMIVTGRVRSARDLAGSGLLDAIDDDVVNAATKIAQDLASGARQQSLLRDRAVDAEAVMAAVEARRTPGLRPAAIAALEAITATAKLPFEEGIALESRIFNELENSPEAKALRYAFFAERAAGKLDGPTVQAKRIETVGIVGSGTMGRGIAIAVARAGISVRLVDANPAALTAAQNAIGTMFDRDVEKNRISAPQRDSALSRITYHEDLPDLRSVDMVIEAVFEDMNVKHEVFSMLDKICRPDAILASNTSMLDINEIASRTSDPPRVVGLHFFSPANVMRLLEVVRSDETSRETLATALDFAKRIGKVAVVAGSCHGFIGNRMLEAYLDRTYLMVEEGVSPYEIDDALEEWGMAMGPFRMLDLVGNDVSHRVRLDRRRRFPETYISPIGEIMTPAGRLGQKSGAGWYDFTPGKARGVPAKAAEQLLEEARRSIGRTPRSYSRGEIVAELTEALAKEGAAILAEGHAASATDIDVVYLNGYGFPRHRGGPMFAAELEASTQS
ncbi:MULTISPECIES: 3-hydroxyacyl-CoA dehydrogenase NAD-binding domain-containing protein [unclassified Chelatococcus]|uniref:3-hydroxyacyl-CoA dehydrogenase NAD-binding domain-containing protein n=1 Tax=unclassified Chelatococcus TaxID=2638111 RepID=UPI001BCE3DFB|nr:MULTISPECIES: 3-hydroxyacyl-CoA dehydrogenase NAD-binding domain-containing protein [unclassified Chelatococcus]MBS7701386.1 enoyl-CoA hydratase/isomerase family protein [Chelatococcus sp. YT9]MBX3557466.1 enoyl-CoA hydratase/isomerase family protein [Chelatococcus sp.]